MGHPWPANPYPCCMVLKAHLSHWPISGSEGAPWPLPLPRFPPPPRPCPAEQRGPAYTEQKAKLGERRGGQVLG